MSQIHPSFRAPGPRRNRSWTLLPAFLALLLPWGAGCGSDGGGGGGGGGGAIAGDMLGARSALTDYDFGERTKKGLAILAGLVDGSDAEPARALRARVAADVLLHASVRDEEGLLDVLGVDRDGAVKMGIDDGGAGGSGGKAFADLLKGWSGDHGGAVREVADGKDKEAAARARILGIYWCTEGLEKAVTAEPSEIEPALEKCGGYVASEPRPWAEADARIRSDFAWLSENAGTMPITTLWQELEERFGKLVTEHGAMFPRAVDLSAVTLPGTGGEEVLDIRTPYALVTAETVVINGKEVATTKEEGLYAKVADPVVSAARGIGDGVAPPPLTVYADAAITYFVVADLMLAAQTAGLDGTVVAAAASADGAEGVRAVRVSLPPPGTDAPKQVVASVDGRNLIIKGKKGAKIPLTDGKLDAAKASAAMAEAAAAAGEGVALKLTVGPKVPMGVLVAVIDAATLPTEAGTAPFGSIIIDPMEGRATGDAVPAGPGPSSADSRGSINSGEVKRIVKTNLPTFRACYEKELKKNHKLRGRVAVRVVVNLDGSVRFAKIEFDNIKNGAIRNCVQKKMASLTFPKPEGGRATFIYPFDFEPTE